MNCPVCAVPLAMSAREGIEIDYCPTCRGVWLDRGELDKIIERSAAQEATPARTDDHERRSETHRYRSDDRSYRPDRGSYDQYGKPKKRKSFFEELFD